MSDATVAYALGAVAAALLLTLVVLVAVRRRRGRFRGGLGLGARGPEDDPRWPGPVADTLRLVLDGRIHAAAERLRRSVEAGLQTPGAYLALGALLRADGEPERAEALHRGLTVRRVLDAAVRAEAFRQVALDLLACEPARLREAAEAAHEAEVHHPGDPVILALARDTAYEAGDIDRALACHYKLVKATGRQRPRIEASLLAARAERAHREGDRSAARRDLRRARKADATCARALFVESRLEEEGGAPDKAAKALRALHEQHPGLDALVLPHLAETLYVAGDLQGLDAIQAAAVRAAERPAFTCGDCGLPTAAVTWRCTRCGAWEAWRA